MNRSAAATAALLLAFSAPVPPAAAADAPPNLPESQDTPVFVDQTVEVVRLENLEIPAVGLEKALIVDPTVAALQIPSSGNSVIVQGLTIGDTYLHLWTQEGRRTIRVSVISPLQRQRQENDLARRRELEFYHADQTVTSSVRRTRYDNTDARYKYQDLTYLFQGNGPTPWGRNHTSVYYLQAKDGRKGLSSADTQFVNKAGLFEAGDVYAQASQLTLSMSPYQGGRWASPDFGSLRLDLFGGYGNKQLYGRGVFPQDEPKERFAGGKATVKAAPGLELFTVGIRTLDDVHPERARNVSAGGAWRDGIVGLRGEKAYSAGGDASYGELDLRRGRDYAVLSHRDVEPGYVTFDGSAWERGRIGQSVQLGRTAAGTGGDFDARYDQYRDRYIVVFPHPLLMNRKWQGRFAYKSQDLSSVQQEFYWWDMPGVDSPSNFRLYRAKLAQEYRKDGAALLPYVSFRREWSRGVDEPALSYAQTGVGAGLNASRGQRMGVGLFIEAVRAFDPQTGRERSVANGSANLYLATSYARPLRHRLDLEYVQTSYRFSDPNKVLSAQVRSDYVVEKTLSFFVLGRVENQSGTGASRSYGAQAGLNWAAAFNVAMLQSRTVKGTVFKDENGDGLQQPDEPGIPGVRVTLNGSGERKTDEAGRFAFASHRGRLSVRMESADLPGNLKLSTPNPRIFEVDGGGDRVVTVPFGVVHSGRIGGTVYIDINENGAVDAGDHRLAGVIVSLDGTRPEVSDAEGQVLFDGVGPGNHQLRPDIMSLPPDMILAFPSDFEVEMKEGDYRDVNFLIQPIRIVRGTAFWDRNGDGVREPGELVVAGIVFRIGERSKATNNLGRYSLDRLAPGRAALAVDEASLRRGGWALARPLPPAFSIPEDRPFVQRDVDIPLRKAR